MKTRKTKILFFLSLLFSSAVFTQNYNPDFFPIGVWSVKGDFRSVDDFLFNVNTAASYHHASFSNLKSEGFNAMYLSYDPIGYTLDTILDIAELYNMKVIPPMQNLSWLISQSNDQTVTDDDIVQAIMNDSIDRIKRSSAILGYYLYDEPLPGWIDFDVLHNARNILTNMTSDAPHPVLSTWNDEQHMSYIDSYLNLDVLMMDTYPFEDGDAEGDLSDYMPSYFSSMPDPPPYSDYINTVRENHCKTNKRPFWVVLQAFGDVETPENGGYWRQAYPKEIRLEVYLAIMQGAKGIWYFLYESEFPYLLGMLDVSGQPTQRLLEVADVNAEINEISGTLLKLNVCNNQSGISIDYGEVKLHVDSSATSPEKYVIAVNTDVFSSSTPTITIKKEDIGYNVQYIQNVNNHQLYSYTENETEIYFSVPIDEGSGVLLKLSSQPSSIDQYKLKNSVRLYPNPVKDNLFVQREDDSTTPFGIYDLQGCIKINGTLQKNNTINVNSLSPGIYLLKLKTNQTVMTTKFIKM